MSRTVRGMIVELRRSLLILNSKMMPVNLGRAGFEDQPESGFPVVPYYARNVLPTQQGYKSAFTPMPMKALATGNTEQGVRYSPIQDVVVYQTRSGDRFSFAMTATGLWGWMSTQLDNFDNNLFKDWALVSATASVVNTYNLWTHCTVDNILYIYCQGENKIYLIGDLSDILNEEGKGATIIYSDEAAFLGISERTPKFINMEGQIGIFKAANRLGFWDSDNAVAWSSAVDKMDFTPDVTTFAGITTFSDVVGGIVMVKSHGKGFIIYSTGSITHCREMPGSPEKFGGSPILGTSGIAYHTQAVSADPDLLHYAWTSNGLASINNGVIEWLEPEVSQYLMDEWNLVRLQVIQQTNLVFSLAQTYKDSPDTLYARIINDGSGKLGEFNVREQEFEYTWNSWLIDLINGMQKDQQDRFPEFEHIEEEPMPQIGSGRALIPCFDGFSFPSIDKFPGLENLSWTNYTNFDLGSIPTYRFPNLIIDFNPATVAQNLSADTTQYEWDYGIQFPGLAETAFENLAGNDFINKLQETIDRITQARIAFGNLFSSNTSPDSGAYLVIEGDPETNAKGQYIGTISTCYLLPIPEIPPYEDIDPRDDPEMRWYPELEETFHNILLGNLEVKDNGCKIQIIGKSQSYHIRFGVRSIEEYTLDCVTAEDAPGYRMDNVLFGKFRNILIIDPVPDTMEEHVLFEAEISGWGYVTNLGTFIKTQRRRASNQCIPGTITTYPIDNIQTPLPTEDFYETIESPIWEPEFVGYGISPDDNPDNRRSFILEYISGTIGYPPSSPLYATFQKGVIAPYYPVYSKALILNTKLNKWGTYDINHSLLFNTLPANKSEIPLSSSPEEDYLIPNFQAGVVPVYSSPDAFPDSNVFEYEGGFGTEGFKDLTNLPCYLTNKEHYSMIRYGKLALNRSGMTKIIGMSISTGTFDKTENNYNTIINVNASLDNISNASDAGTFYQDMTQDAALTKTFLIDGAQEIPFIMVGRWFTVDIKGSFDLSNLVFYGKREGNFRFTVLPQLAPS